MRKRQLRLFAGFPEDSPTRAKLVEKVTASKRWTVSVLKSAADLFGLEKGGSRDDLVERFVDFVISPSELKDVPAPKAKKTKKRKAEKKKTKKEKSDKPKRALTPYIIFSQAKREEIKQENPEATFGEVAKLLGAAWKELGDAGKAEWVEAAATAAAASGDVEGGKKKRRKTEEADSKEESGDESEGSDEEAAADSEGEEEGGEDRDKDLFPDSEEEEEEKEA
jgi:hypothetical protein